VAQPVHRAGWIYEEKYDGWRMLAYKSGDTVQLVKEPAGIRRGAFQISSLVVRVAAILPRDPGRSRSGSA